MLSSLSPVSERDSEKTAPHRHCHKWQKPRHPYIYIHSIIHHLVIYRLTINLSISMLNRFGIYSNMQKHPPWSPRIAVPTWPRIHGPSALKAVDKNRCHTRRDLRPGWNLYLSQLHPSWKLIKICSDAQLPSFHPMCIQKCTSISPQDWHSNLSPPPPGFVDETPRQPAHWPIASNIGVNWENQKKTWLGIPFIIFHTVMVSY